MIAQQSGQDLGGTSSTFSPVTSQATGHPPSSTKFSFPQLGLDDFEMVKVIGKGGFSKVFLVRKKDNGMLYAMKCINKAKIRQENKVQNILNER